MIRVRVEEDGETFEEVTTAKHVALLHAIACIPGNVVTIRSNYGQYNKPNSHAVAEQVALSAADSKCNHKLPVARSHRLQWMRFLMRVPHQLTIRFHR